MGIRPTKDCNYVSKTESDIGRESLGRPTLACLVKGFSPQCKRNSCSSTELMVFLPRGLHAVATQVSCQTPTVCQRFPPFCSNAERHLRVQDEPRGTGFPVSAENAEDQQPTHPHVDIIVQGLTLRALVLRASSSIQLSTDVLELSSSQRLS